MVKEGFKVGLQQYLALVGGLQRLYRPCPGFVASGDRYRRRGQSMDEVAFGQGGASSLSRHCVCLQPKGY
ncbi:unnamed protein product [Lupinus luteus]|uniref:Uncharacterized protein n=1 Tax=Lupinus luteus TaxID=3873 RepID=A0AAV1WTG7_LUPLU